MIAVDLIVGLLIVVSIWIGAGIIAMAVDRLTAAFDRNTLSDIKNDKGPAL